MDLKEFSSESASNRHPWELSRADFFVNVLKRWTTEMSINALDVGSGDTWLAQQLKRNLPQGSTILCVDSSYTPEVLEKLGQLPEGIRLSSDLPEQGQFDFVFLLDVIEHVHNDREFLESIAKNLVRRGGLIVISVPAFQSLFTAHDTWLGHYRRYNSKTAKSLIDDCGLELLESGSLFHGLIFVRALEKLRELTMGPPEQKGLAVWNRSSGFTRTVRRALNLDWRVTEGLRTIGVKLPGLSWWGVCRKP